MKQYVDLNGNLWDGKYITLESGALVFNPTEEMLLQAGYTEYTLPVYVPSEQELLERAKNNKLLQVDLYDKSENINSFNIILNGNTISAWLTPDQRSNYKNSLDSAEFLGLQEVHPIFNEILLTLSTQIAKTALAQILLYADRCYIVTEMHKSAIKALLTVDEVEEYDISSGYPEKLSFTI